MIEAVLVDHMGSDLSVVNAARVTMGVERQEMRENDERLINFLARERHVTPFRHATVTFRCRAPIAIARQLGKHQVGFSWNEMSRRYKDGEVACYVPSIIRQRPSDLHEGAAGAFSEKIQKQLKELFEMEYDAATKLYKSLLDMGVAPEQARFVLPQGMVTEWVWTGSLYGWFEVYRQRSNPHAQAEVQEFAAEIDREMAKLFPIAWSALKATIA